MTTSSKINPFDKFSAILCEKWVIDGSKICGYWAEDHNRYEISAPEQLIHTLVELQNSLHLSYVKRESYKKEMNKLDKFAEEFLQ